MPFCHYSHLSHAFLSVQVRGTLPDLKSWKGKIGKYVGSFCHPAFPLFSDSYNSPGSCLFPYYPFQLLVKP